MAHKDESVEISLALTLSNLISLVRGRSVAGLGTRGQGQLPGGLAVSRPGMATEEAQGPSLARGSPSPGEACSSVLQVQGRPQALSRCPFPSGCSSGGWRLVNVCRCKSDVGPGGQSSRVITERS